YAQHIHQLVKIRFNAPRPVLIGIHDNGHPRYAWRLGAPYRQSLYIERTPAEQNSYPRQDARLIFDVDNECVQHDSSFLCTALTIRSRYQPWGWDGESCLSVRPPPAPWDSRCLPGRPGN